MEENNSKNYRDEISRKIEDMFKDGKIILDGPFSINEDLQVSNKKPIGERYEFMDYLKSEREKCKKMSEVSNDPTFWLGKIDAFLEVERKILDILNGTKKD